MARSCRRHRGAVGLLQVVALVVFALLALRATAGMRVTPAVDLAGMSIGAEADGVDSGLVTDAAAVVQEPPAEMRRVRRARPPDADLEQMVGMVLALALLAWASATRRQPEPDSLHFVPGHDPGWAARGPPLVPVS